MPTPGVYKLDIQQGNVVTGDMLARLEPGMEKRKVRFLLGTPLVADTFNEDRWDYLYSFQEGGGDRSQQHIVLIFEDDRLAGVEGDADNSAINLPPTPKPETVVSVPDQEPEGIFGIGSWFGTDETRVPRKKPPPSDEYVLEEEEGFFASIFDRADEEESTPPAEGETSTIEDAQPLESQEETELERSFTSSEQLPEAEGEDATTEVGEAPDDEGFFARLKDKFSERKRSRPTRPSRQ